MIGAYFGLQWIKARVAGPARMCRTVPHMKNCPASLATFEYPFSHSLGEKPVDTYLDIEPDSLYMLNNMYFTYKQKVFFP